VIADFGRVGQGKGKIQDDKRTPLVNRQQTATAHEKKKKKKKNRRSSKRAESGTLISNSTGEQLSGCVYCMYLFVFHVDDGLCVEVGSVGRISGRHSALRSVWAALEQGQKCGDGEGGPASLDDQP